MTKAAATTATKTATALACRRRSVPRRRPCLSEHAGGSLYWQPVALGRPPVNCLNRPSSLHPEGGRYRWPHPERPGRRMACCCKSPATSGDAGCLLARLTGRFQTITENFDFGLRQL